MGSEYIFGLDWADLANLAIKWIFILDFKKISSEPRVHDLSPNKGFVESFSILFEVLTA